MKAVYFERFQQTPVVAELPDPAPAPDGVVIEVRATGICRSDWHGWMGHDTDIRLPHVPGHEFAGVVVAVGRDVRRWSAGDRVTVPFVGGCGSCDQCSSGNHQVCRDQFQPGFTAWGSYAQYVAIRFADVNLVGLPEELGFDTAASLGCRFATSFRAVVDQGRAGAGQWVAVYGSGGVGLSAIMIARAVGARVVAVDISDSQLALARAVGAEVVVNSAQEPRISERIHKITGGGAHVSIDALGHPATCVDSILSLRRRGRHVQVGLLLASQARPAIPMDRVIAHELEILGSHGMQAWRYPAMLEMIRSGRIAPQDLIGQRLSLADAPAALVSMDRHARTGMMVVTDFA